MSDKGERWIGRVVYPEELTRAETDSVARGLPGGHVQKHWKSPPMFTQLADQRGGTLCEDPRQERWEKEEDDGMRREGYRFEDFRSVKSFVDAVRAVFGPEPKTNSHVGKLIAQNPEKLTGLCYFAVIEWRGTIGSSEST